MGKIKPMDDPMTKVTSREASASKNSIAFAQNINGEGLEML